MIGLEMCVNCRNVIERAVLLADGKQPEFDLPSLEGSSSDYFFKELPTLDELQRRYIVYVLEKTRGRVGGPKGAADVLGMKRSSLYRRMEKLGLR